MSAGLRLVLITAPNARVAHSLARGLIDARLAACVNVVPGVVSHYRWNGTIHKNHELLLIVKTRAVLLARLSRFVRAQHPASLPEILALPVAGGDKRYLAWVGGEC